MTAPAFLFVIGASGAGKTAAVRALEARALPGVRCYHFDSIGVPSAEVMAREWGGGERWQEHATQRWVDRLATNPDRAELVVLEGQTRPSFIMPRLGASGVPRWAIVVVDCAPGVRAERLRGARAQPELASPRMEDWARYLREQAVALGLPVLDTSRLTVEEAADALQREVEEMQSNGRAAT